jgi:hypothetical protein
MEKLTKMLEQLMPLLTFYPPWVKVFFAISFGFLLASLLLYVVLYPSASKKRNEQSAKSDISVDISVMPEADAGNQFRGAEADIGNQSPRPEADTGNQSRRSETDIGNQSLRPEADIGNHPPRPEANTGDQSIRRPKDLMTLTYSVEATGQQITIRPQMPYLSIFANGGPIEGMSYNHSPFVFGLPNLDIKIVNNSNKTIFFTRALFEMDDSRLDNSPILILRSIYESHFTIENVGWGEVRNGLIRFNVLPFTEEAQARRDQLALSEGPYNNEIKLDDFLPFPGGAEVDVSKAISDAGANLKRLDELRKGTHETTLAKDEYENEWKKALGPFLNRAALVYGKIIITADSSAQTIETREIKFSTTVFLPKPDGPNIRPSPHVLPSYQYDVALEINKRNYTAQVPLSHVLKPGEADRFNIRVSAQKSSFHKFRVKLVHNGGEIVSPPIDLQVFIPTSDERCLERDKWGVTGKRDKRENNRDKPSVTLGWPSSKQ